MSKYSAKFFPRGMQNRCEFASCTNYFISIFTSRTQTWRETLTCVIFGVETLPVDLTESSLGSSFPCSSRFLPLISRQISGGLFQWRKTLSSVRISLLESNNVSLASLEFTFRESRPSGWNPEISSQRTSIIAISREKVKIRDRRRDTRCLVSSAIHAPLSCNITPGRIFMCSVVSYRAIKWRLHDKRAHGMIHQTLPKNVEAFFLTQSVLNGKPDMSILLAEMFT